MSPGLILLLTRWVIWGAAWGVVLLSVGDVLLWDDLFPLDTRGEKCLLLGSLVLAFAVRRRTLKIIRPHDTQP